MAQEKTEDKRSKFLREISSMTREEIVKFLDKNTTKVKLVYPMIFLRKTPTTATSVK